MVPQPKPVQLTKQERMKLEWEITDLARYRRLLGLNKAAVNQVRHEIW